MIFPATAEYSLYRQRAGTMYFVMWLILCMATEVSAQAKPDFVISSVDSQWQDDVYQLDVHLRCQLNRYADEAIGKGVAVVIALDVEVHRKRPWYWPEQRVASLEQRYQLKYHALTDHYLLTNLNTGVQSGFPSLATMLESLGTIVDLPVLDRQLLKSNLEYTARMRVRLDLDALPAPLRLLAYVTPGWHQASDWYEWNLAQ